MILGKKTLLFAILGINLSFAMTPTEIIEETMKNNYDLKSLNKSIQIAQKEIELSKKWENPEFAISSNGIDLSSPLSSNSEYMYEISQTFPISNKLSLQENIAKIDKNISFLTLEDKKLELKSKVYEYIYGILIYEKRYELLLKYKENLGKLEDLLTKFSALQSGLTNDILNVQILKSNAQIELLKLKNIIKNLYLNLEEISYVKVENIESSLDFSDYKDIDISLHPNIKIYKEESKKYEELSKLEKSKKYSDLKVSLEYYQEENQDKANLKLSIPLSFYKTEDISASKNRLLATQTLDKQNSLNRSYKIKIETLQNSMQTAMENYFLIENKIIPLQKKLEQNLENYNSFENLKPELLITNLNELINLQLKLLDEKMEYFSNKSRLIYFAGDEK